MAVEDTYKQGHFVKNERDSWTPTNNSCYPVTCHTQRRSNQEQQPFVPSLMRPPSSPTLSSYNYEKEDEWINNYYDPKRYQLSECHTLNQAEHQQQQQRAELVPREQQQQTHSCLGHIPATHSVIQDIIQRPQFSSPAQHTQWTTELRDALLQYAHSLYSTTPSSPLLLSLLHSVHDAYPSHLPTLLLLACVYYSLQDYAKSIQYNQLILKYDPYYVEAMSNIGTTLRILGQTSDAEKWWYQAVRLRPGYWDAVENLIGVLCSTSSPNALTGPDKILHALSSSIPPNSPSESARSRSKSSQKLREEQRQISKLVSRFKEALEVCEYVENHFSKQMAIHSGVPGTASQKHLPALQIPRLQNLFYAKGNLKSALGDLVGAQLEYEKGLKLVFGGASLESVVRLLASACGSEPVAAAGNGRDKTADASSLPVILLQPEQATHATQLMYPQTVGLLPGLVELGLYANKQQIPTSHGNIINEDTQSILAANAIRQTMQTTSAILLNLAKIFQDHMNSPSKSVTSSNESTHASTPSLALLLPLYYLSLALNPSPSTANNLGIILSNLNGTVCSNAVQWAATPGTAQSLSGTMRAMQYYVYGLKLDARHPHLYTNLGSLLKDMGHLQEAICMYEKAIEFSPEFDIALANLGNAIKDQGRVQDSVQYYRRAVQANPDFVDAICGLVNSLGGICDWRGRGSVEGSFESTVDDEGGFVTSGQLQRSRSGWHGQLVTIVEKQLDDGRNWGEGILRQPSQQSSLADTTVGEYLIQLLATFTSTTTTATPNRTNTASSFIHHWRNRLSQWTLKQSQNEKKNEGGWLIRLLERIVRRMQRQWYLQHFGRVTETNKPQPTITVDQQLAQHYQRPQIPSELSSPPVPTVLPFHTFTYPLTARQIRLISHRNALRVSHATLTSSWVSPHVYPPPPPPCPRLKIGYVSSDFNNHPLAHLMQSVFGFHDRQRYDVYCYATTPSDATPYRKKIESESEHFLDVSHWSNQQVVERVVTDGIHILVNLNGYTKGARNEIFAARCAPVQCSFMGYAGTLGAGWCDWIIADPIVCPPGMVSCEVQRKRYLDQDAEGVDIDYYNDLDPEDQTDDFVYTEKFIYMPHSYFVNDHKQGFQEEKDQNHSNGCLQQPSWKNNNSSSQFGSFALSPIWNQEEERRRVMRRELFPELKDDVIIFANFNQLYKLEPSTFRLWLRVLERVPNSILWLLRFPPAGEHHLTRSAKAWAGDDVARRIHFTDVAPKEIHIHRGRVADIFLDTPECNAHTTAADILWSGTPILTYPKYKHKMCSRVGASIAYATGFGNEMVVASEKEYEERAVRWALGISHRHRQHQRAGKLVNGIINRKHHRQSCIDQDEVTDLRRRLFLTREHSRLFDTLRWTRNLERGYHEAWRRWVTGQEMEDLSPTSPYLKCSGCIWVTDPDDNRQNQSQSVV